MTKEELLSEVINENYIDVQRKIREAMVKGEDHETFGLVGSDVAHGWEIFPRTIERLRKDGFEVQEDYGSPSGVMVKW